ncbi:conserved Plasmodium protein, unknown function [Plasmodium reichenowi]|uniref:Uncharacterized protein n=1 Tax=Plasmodium reichenowi TaxID=5854 RepID=A0A060RTQ5_PLARE|nr:hypothetical protein PRSY57_1101500 [Plasmodium reichenowi]KYN96365.1 hypothetical protein PRSY57_1101500 [Plasmodium reichenowi]CDO64843.1 conserved Plasmodium protein, unknown function [Plasmodium reichenowi]SOV79969.1 conserved Plasmodium protein, unknown function [Plasmodium reichenowi]
MSELEPSNIISTNSTQLKLQENHNQITNNLYEYDMDYDFLLIICILIYIALSVLLLKICQLSYQGACSRRRALVYFVEADSGYFSNEDE